MISGRHIKKGLDSYRIPTVHNEQDQYLLNKCKMYGYGLYTLILSRIYGTEGYYCLWNEQSRLCFCDKAEDLGRIDEVVDCCFKIGLFNRDIFNKYSILTSAEIQKTYLQITHAYKRKSITINPKIKLISEDCEKNLWRKPEKIVNIYLMQVGESDIYKIGYCTITPKERMRAIKHYVPNIKIIDYVLCEFKHEKELHKLFKDKNIEYNGFTEYFKLSQEDVEYMMIFFKQNRNRFILKDENKALDT